MKVRFYAVEHKPAEMEIARALGEGVCAFGDDFDVVPASSYCEPELGVDMACAFALKGHAKAILDGYAAMGRRTLLVDKGLTRASTGLGGHRGWYRVALDEFMPLGRIERMMREGVSSARWVETGLKPRSYRPRGERAPVIYAGSSQKYCDFHGLGNATEYAEDLLRRIAKASKRDVVYRPKPSWGNAERIKGYGWSRPPETLASLLHDAYALVTHGSHAGIDAIIAGVPAVVIGPGAARPVSATDIAALRDRLPYPDDDKRFRWLAALGWWQWRPDEMADGSMWRFLREEMERPGA